MPTIDVLIPSYQYGRFLRDAAVSVLTQDVSGLRLLIIDNASTDDSVQVAKEIAASDPRVEVRTLATNRGPTASINEGIDWAEADYFTMVCADDLLTPGALSRAVTFLDANPPAAFVHGQEIEFRDGTAIPKVEPCLGVEQWQVTHGRSFIEERCRHPAGYVFLGTMVVRTSTQKRAGHYRAELKATQDLEMMLRLAMLGDVGATTSIQGIRRIHGASLSKEWIRSRTNDLTFRQAAFESFFAEEGNGLASVRSLRRLVIRKFATQAWRWALREMYNGHLAPARDLMGYAIRASSMAVRP